MNRAHLHCHILKGWITALTLLCTGHGAHAQEIGAPDSLTSRRTHLVRDSLGTPETPARPYRWFYAGREYGTEGQYNPVSLLLNGSYDIVQLAGNSRQIGRYTYALSARWLGRNIGNPFGVISRFGWERFVRSEVLPIEWRKSQAQWWPNYQLHLIGGGMTYTAMEEWYALHGFDGPRWWSAATVAVYHVLNEVMEIGPYETVDPISDLYIFDVGGIILFSFDNVRAFFSETLHMADWSLQPSFAFAPLSLENNGQYFSFKWRLPFSEHLHLFYLTGLNGIAGLSWKNSDGTSVSAGAGMRAERLVHLPDASQRTAKLVWTAGVFYDRESSLLASLVLTGYTENLATLNVYPGLIDLGGFSPGVWCTVTHSGRLLAGITTRWVPGLSVK